MKIEDVAYAVAGETLVVLEEKYHQSIAQDHKHDIQEAAKAQLGDIRAALQKGEGAASVSIEDVIYAVAGETLKDLETKHHYRIPEEHKRDIQRTVQGRLNAILASLAKAAQAVADGALADEEAEGEDAQAEPADQ